MSPRNEIFAESGESIFSTITRWASEHDAVDLGQGYPGYNPPDGLLRQLRNLETDNYKSHQYAPSIGVSALRSAIAELYDWKYGLHYDKNDEITVTTGATEALSASLYGLLNEGDEVVVFEPVYDLYTPVARRAGASVRAVPLSDFDFNLPLQKLSDVMSEKTDLVIMNNPHNPTGTVFDSNSLKQLVDLCSQNDVYIISDEVYEHLVFEPEKFTPLASLEGARERTLTIGSAGKMLDATGWKTGWALGPEELTESLRRSHQFTTFASATPLQVTLARYLDEVNFGQYFQEFRDQYRSRYGTLQEGIKDSEFRALTPEGTYFLPVYLDNEANISSESNDLEIVRATIEQYGVAMIPLSSFYQQTEGRERIFRLAFCKEKEKLHEGAKRLGNFRLADLRVD